MNGKRLAFTIAIDWTPFTPFQREALQAVFRIPYGETRTYIDIAREIDHPHAYRAVGAANAMNPMPIIVPCHRVLGTDGKLHGYGGGDGLPITAPASGVVVFTGPWTVRGNATVIDHGWGVYSGFWHQSATQVQVGQTVKIGDVIGLVGGTGRVTGAHLHWELWVNGVQVDPLDWLNQTYP